MSALHEFTIRANGLTFTATSQGVGPVVLCLHGFPDHRNTFRHQFQVLADNGYRAIAPTLRGYEPSSQPPDGDYHVVRMAEDVVAWLDALGESQVHIVGHDWGAIIAYTAVAMAPERFLSLTTLAVPHIGGLLRHRALRKRPRHFRKFWYIMFFQLPLISDLILSHRDWSFVEMLWRTWSPGWTPPRHALSEVKDALAQPGVRAAALAYYRSFLKVGPTARKTVALQFAPVETPTLAITGRLDGCVDTELFDVAMKEEDFPAGLCVHRVEGAGHFVHQERPQEINPLLISWLGRHSPHAER